jgi:hypothetical protein
MDAITQALTDKFRGQALAAAEGYSGSIDRLAVASANAKEIIGKDLLDAMQLIAGKDGIGGATTAMEGFATQIGNAIYGIGVLIAKLKEIPGAGFIADVLTAPTGLLALTSNFGKNRKATAAGTPAQSPGQRRAIDKANADALKLAKTKNALSTIDNANTTRKLVLTADQQALEELKKKFDVERIGLFAALNNATDQETQMRLRSLIAIHDNDAALALKIKNELAAAEAAKLLETAMKNSLSYWATWQTEIGNAIKAAAMAALASTATTTVPTATTYSPTPYAPGDIPGISGQRGFRFAGADSSPTFVINAQGIGDQQIATVVQNAIQELNRYGNSTTYAGAL